MKLKIDLFETHDRYKSFLKQSDNISQGCQECIHNRPNEYGNHPFYIFAHKRSLEIDERVAMFNADLHASIIDISYKRKYYDLNSVPTARLIWSPRLTKPLPQENSMLFRAYPPGDEIKIMWVLPDKSLWDQYEKEDMITNQVVKESIHDFIYCMNKLKKKEDDDLSQDTITSIMREIAYNAQRKKHPPKPIVDFRLVS